MLWAILGAVLATGVAFFPAPAAFAHGYLDVSVPGRDEVVSALPEAVTLTFTEAVEVRASIFKVYALEPDDDPLRLRAQAARLADEALQIRGDEERRADAGVQAEGREAKEIRILLKDGLAPGPYVVMWRVLSVDTHITWGHFVFTYAPDEG